MIDIFCRHHHAERPCLACDALLAYMERRIAQCPYGESKPACSSCQTHCYREEMRLRVQAVMRFAGPRMITRHPLMAFRHLLNQRRTRRTLPPCFPKEP